MKALIVNKDSVIRSVSNINDSFCILQNLNENSYFDGKVVQTKISEEFENSLEHEFLSPILHSEEYTTSMAYDVTKLGIEMALEAEKSGIYSFDLLPHNYTFLYGNWILYDFGAFETTPKNVKTQLRGDFQISFAAFEILNLLDRKSLGKCFLNRFSVEDMFKILPFFKFFRYFCKLSVGKLLYYLKQYKQLYEWLLYVQNRYEKHLLRHTYITENKFEASDFVDNFLNKYNIKSVFGVGNSAREFAICYENINSFVYLDDYEICDEFYNYIISNKINHVGTGVLYPLADDKKISQTYHYRALYDSYAQARFLADCVFVGNYEETAFGVNTENFLNNISNFSKNAVIIECLEPNNELLKALENIFEDVSSRECGENKYIFAAGRKADISLKQPNEPYHNNNRGYEKKEQAEKVLKILKKKS